MIQGLQRDGVALVVIDIQERLLKIMDEATTKQTLFTVELLIRWMRQLNAPVLCTEQYPRGLGKTVSPVMQALGENPIIEKDTFSCWRNSEFANQLQSTGRTHVILTGMETHVCVLRTALDLKAAGYHVYVPLDGVQSSTQFRQQNGLELMEKSGVVIANGESLGFQMLQSCRDPDFKFFSNLLKKQYISTKEG